MNLSSLVASGSLVAMNAFHGQRLRASRTPFTAHRDLLPHTHSRRWGSTHFGVFVPDLPAPYRFVNTMTLIGPTSAEVFDQDHLAAADARHTATVLAATGLGDQHFVRSYDSVHDCDFAPDGSRLRWGRELEVTVDLPTVTVHGNYPQFAVDLELDVTDQASYFIKTPFYDHFSLLAPYRGTVNGQQVSGLGTVEYGRITGLAQPWTRRPVPAALKFPIDLFTYQIIPVDDHTQLLLTDVRARENVLCRLLHVRTLGGATEVYDDVAMNVAEWDEQRDTQGRTMRVPRVFSWAVIGSGGRQSDCVLEITGRVDGPWREGHGRGYVAPYSYSGTFRSQPISGSAYIEWVDVRS